MPKDIPTVDYTLDVSGAKRTIKLYQWLTQTEEDEYYMILAGDTPFSPGDNNPFLTTVEKVRKSNRYLIEHFLADMTINEYDVLPPRSRNEIYSEVDRVYIESKKK